MHMAPLLLVGYVQLSYTIIYCSVSHPVCNTTVLHTYSTGCTPTNVSSYVISRQRHPPLLRRGPLDRLHPFLPAHRLRGPRHLPALLRGPAQRVHRLEGRGPVPVHTRVQGGRGEEEAGAAGAAGAGGR